MNYPTGDQTAAKQYEDMARDRDVYLSRARDSASLTIPMLMPPSGHSSSTVYDQPYSSVAARGVNNLASKLLMTLLPPNAPFFRLTIDDFDLQELAGDDARGQAEEALARIERSAAQLIEAKAVRVPAHEAIKQLIVAGNVLTYLPKDGGMKVYRLDRYVCKRDTMGNLLKVIVKEEVSFEALPDMVRKTLMDQPDYNNITPETEVDLFTCIRREGKKMMVHQEVKGIMIPKSEGSYPIARSPWMALRFISVDGENYGRGFVEEYIGDIKSLESLTTAIVEGSAAAAKVLFMVRPNGTTRASVLANSPNGGIVTGDANDVSTLQLDKFNDFRVAQETIVQITERLSAAFLLNSSITRNAERVTAEEIRYMAQELETALGGIYSTLSQEFQLPLVNILLYLMQKEGKMPKFPDDAIKPQIVTGLEALGRGQDLSKLSSLLEYLQPLGAETIQKYLNVGDYIDRLGASLGIDTQGLIKSEDQLSQEQQAAQEEQEAAMQQQQMADMAKGAAPAMAKGVMDYTGGQPTE